MTLSCCHRFISNSCPGITGWEGFRTAISKSWGDACAPQSQNIGEGWGTTVKYRVLSLRMTDFYPFHRLQKISKVIKSNLISVSALNDKIMPFSQHCKRADSSKTCGSICNILQQICHLSKGEKNDIVMNYSGRALQMLPSAAIIYFLAEIHCCATHCENPVYSWSL